MHSVLVEQSVIGWKEYELEVMRDGADNVVIVCSIENLDPMGVHTGDSITVAPAMTLTDREYQVMRDRRSDHGRSAWAGRRRQRPVRGGPGHRRAAGDRDEPAGVALSALASKATGFPIARRSAPRSRWATARRAAQRHHRHDRRAFEPVLDYVVKIPRFAFEKFPPPTRTLTTRMKAVGEVMAIGRTFRRPSRRPALAGDRADGLGDPPAARPAGDELAERAGHRGPTPAGGGPTRALTAGWTVDESPSARIDPWFVDRMRPGRGRAPAHRRRDPGQVGKRLLERIKRLGFSDRQLADLRGTERGAVRARRVELGIRPAYKVVDTCAGEFPADALPLLDLRRGDRGAGRR